MTLKLVAVRAAGDRIAFGRLLTRHWEIASSVCARLLSGDRDAIDDVLQETSVVALVSLDRLRDPDRFSAWLCGIALNIARRRIREARRTHPAPALPEPVVPGDPGPAEHAEAADLARRVRDAISDIFPAANETQFCSSTCKDSPIARSPQNSISQSTPSRLGCIKHEQRSNRSWPHCMNEGNPRP